MQKRVVRYITCVSKKSPSDPLFKSLGKLKLSHVYKLQVIMFVYKFKHNLLRTVLQNIFVSQGLNHRYNTRQADNIYPPRFKYNLSKTLLKYKGSSFWNSLDLKTKQMNTSVECFKKYIIAKCL